MSEKSNICPKTEKCPLFQGEMLVSKKAQDIYMRIFCKAGEKGRNRCRRFQLVKEGFNPASDIMPNDDRTVDDIIKDM